MTALTIRLPDSVHLRIKELAAKDGVSVNQFIASAAAEKMASIMTLDYLRAEAAQGRRDDFLAVLASAADEPPAPGDERPLTPDAAKPSEPTFAKVWDNDDDAAYDRL